MTQRKDFSALDNIKAPIIKNIARLEIQINAYIKSNAENDEYIKLDASNDFLFKSKVVGAVATILSNIRKDSNNVTDTQYKILEDSLAESVPKSIDKLATLISSFMSLTNISEEYRKHGKIVTSDLKRLKEAIHSAFDTANGKTYKPEEKTAPPSPKS